MGFAHEWKWKKPLTDQQWAATCEDAQKLFDALPAKIEKGMFIDGYTPDAAGKKMNALHKKRYAIPAVAGFERGHVFKENVITFKPEKNDGLFGVCDDFVLTRNEDGYCKTQSTPYDRVVTGVLMVCHTHADGSIAIEWTDSDKEQWLSQQKWGASVLGKDVRLPKGAPGYKKLKS